MAGSSHQVRNDANWDRLGIGLSVLCLVHCLALPWLLATLPVVMLATLPAGLRENEWLHAALIAPVLLVSGPVLLRGRPRIERTVLVVVAFAALVGALFVSNAANEQALTVAGGLMLLAAHWDNLHRGHPS
jgi:hypothetical protein